MLQYHMLFKSLKKGVEKAIEDIAPIKTGVNVIAGKVTNKAVADDLGYEYVPVDEVVKYAVTV